MAHDPKFSYNPPVTKPSRLKRGGQLLLAVVGWCLFVWFWYRVFYRTPSEESVRGVLSVAGLLLVSTGLTLGWVRHNLLLARKFEGRRRNVREVIPSWTHDAVGRPLVAPNLSDLQMSPGIEVRLDDQGRKEYRAL